MEKQIEHMSFFHLEGHIAENCQLRQLFDDWFWVISLCIPLKILYYLFNHVVISHPNLPT